MEEVAEAKLAWPPRTPITWMDKWWEARRFQRSGLAPDCGQNASITVTKDMGGSKIYPRPMKLWTTPVTRFGRHCQPEANTCIAFELTSEFTPEPTTTKSPSKWGLFCVQTWTLRLLWRIRSVEDVASRPKLGQQAQQVASPRSRRCCRRTPGSRMAPQSCRCHHRPGVWIEVLGVFVRGPAPLHHIPRRRGSAAVEVGFRRIVACVCVGASDNEAE